MINLQTWRYRNRCIRKPSVLKYLVKRSYNDLRNLVDIGITVAKSYALLLLFVSEEVLDGDLADLDVEIGVVDAVEDAEEDEAFWGVGFALV